MQEQIKDIRQYIEEKIKEKFLLLLRRQKKVNILYIYILSYKMKTQSENKMYLKPSSARKLKLASMNSQLPNIDNKGEKKNSLLLNNISPPIYPSFGQSSIRGLQNNHEYNQIQQQLNDFQHYIAQQLQQQQEQIENFKMQINSQKNIEQPQNTQNNVINDDNQYNDNQFSNINSMILQMQSEMQQQQIQIQTFTQDKQYIDRKIEMLLQQSQSNQIKNSIQTTQIPPNINQDNIILNLQQQIQDLQIQHTDIKKQQNNSEIEIRKQIQKTNNLFTEENSFIKQNLKQQIDKKQAQNIQDADYQKQIFQQLDIQIKQEVQQRVMQEYDQKANINKQLNLFKEEVRGDEKQIMENEQKFIKQIQESIVSLNRIVKLTKEEMETNLQSTQTLFGENIKSIKQNIEATRGNQDLRLDLLDKGQVNLANKQSETHQKIQDNMKFINNIVNEIKNNYEQESNELRKEVKAVFGDQNVKIKENLQQLKSWEETFEKKNYDVFNELTAALKGLRNEQLKENSYVRDKFKSIQILQEEGQELNKNLFNNFSEQNKKIEDQWNFQFKQLSDNNLEQIKFLQQNIEQQMKTSENFVLSSLREDIHNQNKNLEDISKQYCNNEVQTQCGIVQDNTTDLIQQQAQVFKEYQIQQERNNDNIQTRIDMSVKENNQINNNLQQKVNQDIQQIQQQERQNRVLVEETLIPGVQKSCYSYVESQNQNVYKDVDLQMNQQNRFLSNEITKVNLENKVLNNNVKEEIYKQIKEENQITQKDLSIQLQMERNERMAQNTSLQDTFSSTKTLILENLQQKIESIKSLSKALVMEEAAERSKSDQLQQEYTNNQTNQYYKKGTAETDSKIQMMNFELKNEISKTLDQQNDLKTWILKEIQKIKDGFKDQEINFEAVQCMNKLQFELIGQNVNSSLDKTNAEITSLHHVMNTSILELTRNDYDHNRHFGQLCFKVEEFIENNNINLLTFQKIIENNHKEVAKEVTLQQVTNQLIFDHIKKAQVMSQEKLRKVNSYIQSVIQSQKEQAIVMRFIEDTVQGNFEVSEKALKHHTQFLNNLDAQVYLNDLETKLYLENLNNTIENKNQMLMEAQKNQKNEMENKIENTQVQLHSTKESFFGRIDRIDGQLTERGNIEEEKGKNIENQLKEMESKNEYYQKDLEQITKQVNNNTEEIQKNQHDISEFKKDFNQEIENNENNNKQIQENIKRNMVDIDNLQLKADQSDKVFDDINDTIQHDKQIYEQQINELRDYYEKQKDLQDISDVKNKIDNIENQVTEIGQILNTQQSVNEEQTKQQNNFRELITKQQDNINSLQNDVEDIQKKIQ